MDRIELAQRRYGEIVDRQFAVLPRAERHIRMPTSALRVWLKQDVMAVIDEIHQRPRFRELATWSLQTLVAGSETKERTAIERVDQALRVAARTTGRLAENTAIEQQLEAMAKSKPSAEPQYGVSSRMDRLNARIPEYREQLAGIANGAWTDLVCRQDFLWPVGGMMRPEPLPEGATEGAFVVSLQPALFAVGDFITRCCVQRIMAWKSVLEEARYVVHAAMQAVQRSYSQQVAAQDSAWRELRESCREVEFLCLTGSEFRLREACVSAVQVYAEFHPSPDLGWLPLEDRVIQHFRGRLDQNIFGSRDLETIDRIAGSLGELRLLYHDMSPDYSAMDEAIATEGLVLVDKESQREVYWQGRLVDVEWFRNKKPWEMLVKLVLAARLGAAVSWHDLYSEGPALSTVPNRWRRLNTLLPATLSKWVEPGRNDPRSYRLTLPADRIHMFRADRSRSRERTMAT